jgi:heptosyltransferase-2
MNTGAGGRWAKKSWKVEEQIELVRLAKEKHPGWQILLLGGPEEVERNKILEKSCANLVLNTGQHPVRKFAALVGQTHVLITADTLALHIGLALGRQVVVFFGPTSHEEIDLCASGEKLFAELDCLGCYLNDCDKSPDCMDLISPEMVLAAVERRLEKV